MDGPRIAINKVQHKIVNLLKTFVCLGGRVYEIFFWELNCVSLEYELCVDKVISRQNS